MSISLHPKPTVDQEALSSSQIPEDKHDFNSQVKDNDNSDRDSDVTSEGFTKDAQAGVVAMEATTSVWSRRDLIIAYVL